MKFKDLTIKEHIADMKASGYDRGEIAPVIRRMRALIRTIARDPSVIPGQSYTMGSDGRLWEVNEDGSLASKYFKQS